MNVPAGPAPSTVQTSLDDLGTPLADVTFVVVDLETTGGRPEAEGITEIGAVKVRGGQVLGEFATLVDPGSPVPVQIQRLTGITTSMLTDAPRIASVLPQFLEFVGADSVLVAHNARFDVGFLRAAADGLGLDWAPARVVDTVKLARGLVPRDEVPNHKLGTLAAHFGAATTPNHRALSDARATVDVLHALLGRAGSLGVVGLEDLLTFSGQVPQRRRRKASLADGLPSEPGVYIFTDASGSPLYVGTSQNIRQRVRSYFTASETRRRMGEMVDLAVEVRSIPCATALEARVREVRLIAQHRPPYNRRSKNPQKTAWLKLTVERFPRLSVVRVRKDDAAVYVGPFRSAGSAEQARDAVHSVRRLRQCTVPITRTTQVTPCALAELGRCDAPCTGQVTPQEYARISDPLATELLGATTPLVRDLEERIRRLAQEERFEDARRTRDGLLALLEGLDRAQRRAPLVTADIFVGARPRSAGGWEFAIVKHARLTGTAVSPPGSDPRPVIDSLVATSESVDPTDAESALAEETDIVLRWLERPGTRLVDSTTSWSCPIDAAAPHLLRLAPTIREAQGVARERDVIDPPRTRSSPSRGQRRPTRRT